MSDYDSDILLWSERQDALLRRRAAGELVNDRELDWPNIAEEIESVGRSQLSAVRSYITQALAHDLKAAAWHSSQATPGWRAEAIRFRQEAAEAFAPSMRPHIDMARLYALATSTVRRFPPIGTGVTRRECGHGSALDTRIASVVIHQVGRSRPWAILCPHAPESSTSYP